MRVLYAALLTGWLVISCLAAGPIQRNKYWNEFVNANRAATDLLREVDGYLVQHETEGKLSEIDASMILKLDKAIALRKVEVEKLSKLRTELTK